MSTRFYTLAQWLAWQETLHPKAIDPGLERVHEVAVRLGLHQPNYRVITVGGTNGKGSCVAFLDAILRTAGYRVGAYTSPHLLRYNERIRINGREVDDAALCHAFTRIDAARGAISLTYFEFGTLAALDIFREAGVEVAVLEVGLGGRLDAVNILDADAALITSIDLDHMEWLGPDRDSIGFEKAGIYRAGRPAICADPSPPARLINHARNLGALFIQAGQDYTFQCAATHWQWRHGSVAWEELPLPKLFGRHQIANAAAALMTLHALSVQLPITIEAIRKGLEQAGTLGRFQIISGPVEWILDVAHNAHAANALAQGLRDRPCSGRTWVVLGMLADKDAATVIRPLNDLVDGWLVASLEGQRGRTGFQLANTLKQAGITASVVPFSGVPDACLAAARQAIPGDRIVVCGSFYTVAQALTVDKQRFWFTPEAGGVRRG
ncbi:MAG: bifunctional tetrahydrofolate synthase/dihydrofolate synthase [Candidatus Competibacteraceae bacterium]|jgi:dihydrofolate synthase/folylpolyglutamate synthase|nr:bifunctional tetrahydrofolate synthase/dihydrofolate synthase [Candidatus Competibacteraceae bacterium]